MGSPMPHRFASMDVQEADKECSNMRNPQKRYCPVCLWAVMLHCGECFIQITGCVCTAEERGVVPPR